MNTLSTSIASMSIPREWSRRNPASPSARRTAITELLLAAVLGTALAASGGGSSGRDGGGGTPLTFTVGGTVTGLSGTVVLGNFGGDELALSANGAFAFSKGITNGAAYNVTVRSPPSYPAQDCVVSNGSGMARANVTNVAVVCSLLPIVDLVAKAGVRSTTLSWTSPGEATGFDIYVSSARDCDISNYASCPDGALLANVASPHTIRELHNGQAYFFTLETTHANGSRGLSNEAGARPNVLAFNDGVTAIASGADGTTYLGGIFTEVGIVTGSEVPIDVTSGRLDAPDFPIVVGTVSAVAPDGTGGWYLGGSFTRVGDVPRNNLAHILANGTVDPNFMPVADDDVFALAVSGSIVYVGGAFSRLGGELRSSLGSIDASGALQLWNPNANDPVFALAVSPGIIYVGGSFTGIGTQPRNHLAAIDESGAPLVWNPNPNDSVRALAISGSTLYVGGPFTQMGLLSRHRLAAFDTSGALLAWNPLASSIVHSLAVAGKTVHAGGFFNELGGLPRTRFGSVTTTTGEAVP